MTIDNIGLALDLESRAKTVESQTTERAMVAAANALRALASPSGAGLGGAVASSEAVMGWKFVPLEPTEEMLKAGNKKTWPLPSQYVYSEMLAAAPRAALASQPGCAVEGEALSPATVAQPVTEDELDAIESAFDYVFHFAKDPKDGHIAQNICDTLQRLERRLRGAQPCASQGCGGAVNNGAPFGIIDPDYARIFTKARILAWQYGYALVMHGSFTRDLDLLLVPWEQRAFSEAVPRIVKMLAEQCDLKIRADDPADKPHGRKCWSLHLPGFGEPRWVDLSVMPARAALDKK